jgi:hypothetical protein
VIVSRPTSRTVTQHRKNGDSTKLHFAGGYGAVLHAAHGGPLCYIDETRRQRVFEAGRLFVASSEGKVASEGNARKEELVSTSANAKCKPTACSSIFSYAE